MPRLSPLRRKGTRNPKLLLQPSLLRRHSRRELRFEEENLIDWAIVDWRMFD